jgi:predicted  nucleic acid-binding Zn-ribbon protein
MRLSNKQIKEIESLLERVVSERDRAKKNEDALAIENEMLRKNIFGLNKEIVRLKEDTKKLSTKIKKLEIEKETTNLTLREVCKMMDEIKVGYSRSKDLDDVIRRFSVVV